MTEAQATALAGMQKMRSSLEIYSFHISPPGKMRQNCLGYHADAFEIESSGPDESPCLNDKQVKHEL